MLMAWLFHLSCLCFFKKKRIRATWFDLVPVWVRSGYSGLLPPSEKQVKLIGYPSPTGSEAHPMDSERMCVYKAKNKQERVPLSCLRVVFETLWKRVTALPPGPH